MGTTGNYRRTGVFQCSKFNNDYNTETNMIDDNIIRDALIEHDIYHVAHEASKQREELVSINYEKIQQLFIEFYTQGFKDGYKTHRGDEKTEWGCWKDDEI